MKTQKIILTFLLAFLTIGVALNASSDPNKTTWKQQMVDYLDKIDLTDHQAVDNILIDFMINDKSEIIVLSTNIPELDSNVKARLNYRKINNESFEAYKKYTLPVRFDKG